MIEAGEIEELCRALALIPSAVLSDVLEAGGLRDQVLSHELLRLRGDTFVGPAVCLSGSSAAPPDAGRSAAIVFEADRAMFAGCVAMLATDRHRVGAATGGNTTASWAEHGCRAVVTDGLVRDLDAMTGLTVHAAGRTLPNTKGRWAYHALSVPVRLPGQTTEWVTIAPGDVVHGDGDGVIVIPRQLVRRVLADASQTLSEENRMMERIRGGVDREIVYREARRFNHIAMYA
jgi:4-hydroxy-4-methyl-2-oxoglutarate aldolase